MRKEEALKRLKGLLKGTGITINGSNPWDIKINYNYIVPLYYRIIRYHSLGLGEAYMDKWWTCESPEDFYTKLLQSNKEKELKNLRTFMAFLKSYFFNLQSGKGSHSVIEKHYNLPVKVYESFLDNYNQYTCGYFKNTEDANIAQIKKMDLICKKLQLKETDTLLDIGCGWGGFAKYAAETCHCNVVGITLSEEQAKYARNFTKGLPVEIIVKNYKELKTLGKGSFNKVSCIGMIEHVGYKNYRKFMKLVNYILSDNGIFLLHTISSPISNIDTDPFIGKYIFPNSMIPSGHQILKSVDHLFDINDLHDFGSNHYEKTLMFWLDKFKKNFKSIESNVFDKRFYRMFETYFAMSIASFRTEKNLLYQYVFSKNLQYKYIPVR